MVGVGVLATLMSGCGVRIPTPASRAPARFDRPMSLNDRTLTLHLADAPRSSSPLLIMYVTGDGGWHHKDLAVYRQLVKWGYPVVGVSAPEYLKPFRQAKRMTTPVALARDYEAILTSAKAFLGMPPRAMVVLVGVSRGADLAIVAAGRGMLKSQLAGVVAVGLTKEEEFVGQFRRVRGRNRDLARVATVIQLYSYLPRIGATPVSIIQSTHDTYVPAAEARKLYGADTERRHFLAVESRDHSFSDARSALYSGLHVALDWVSGLSRAEFTE